MKEDIFQQIQDDNTAYWLGFIAADGSLFEERYKLQIGLSSKDREHLEKFKLFLNSDNSITDRMTKSSNNKFYASSYFTIQNQNIYNDLSQYNIIPNKSYQNINFLSYIPDKYKIPFLIGIFDGDGWFTNTERTINFGFCGNQNMVITFHQYLHQQLFKQWQSTENVLQNQKSLITYYFTIHTQSEIIDWCKLYLSYSNKCDLLQRKKEVALDIINKLEFKILERQKQEEYKKSLSRDKKTHKILKNKVCPICKKEFQTIHNEQIYCSQECAHKVQYYCEHPTKENLYQELKENKGNFCAVARNYNVSDNTIRKWCKSYGLPFHTYDYKENLIQTTRGVKKVAQINLTTGEIIAIFNSMKEAAELVFNDGKKNKLISDVCHGRQKSSGGYGWKILEE